MNVSNSAKDERQTKAIASTLPFDIEHVAGIPFQVLTLREAVDWTVNTAGKDHLPVNIRLGNAWTVALAHDDIAYRRLLTDRGVNFPDGTPVMWMMNIRRRGRNRAGHVRGPSFFNEVFKHGEPEGTRHFLLGSSPETLEALTAALRDRYPDCQIVGTYSPPFAPVDADYLRDCASHVRRTNADLVWVGLGTPKQDVVGTALADELGLTTLNVGAAFDFASNRVREAPKWLQSTGFEWLYRFASEPRRLCRRYIYGNARFLWVSLTHQRRRKAKHSPRLKPRVGFTAGHPGAELESLEVTRGTYSSPERPGQRPRLALTKGDEKNAFHHTPIQR